MLRALRLAMPIVFLTANAFAQEPPKTRYVGKMDDYYKANTLDLDLSGGGGFSWAGPGRGVGFFRARTGVLFARWPICFSLGTTFEINNLAAATYGLQAEAIHISSGLWLQLGGMLDGHGQLGGMASVGWSFFGIEAQYRGYDEPLVDRRAHDGYGFAVVGKLRIPIGFILYAISRK